MKVSEIIKIQDCDLHTGCKVVDGLSHYTFESAIESAEYRAGVIEKQTKLIDAAWSQAYGILDPKPKGAR